MKLTIQLLLVCLLCTAVLGDKLQYVFQYNTHGERTPIFTEDPHFDITHNKYKQGPNQLTLTGLRNAFSQGEVFKKKYASGTYYEGDYSPHDYFIRALPDNPSVMSAYAFMLGTNPEQVEGLGLVEEKGTPNPVTDAYIDDARRALYLDRAGRSAKPVYIHAGNADGFFFKDFDEMYPKLKKDFDNNVKDASNEFQYKHGSKLYYKLSSLLNVPRDSLNFESVAKYLDDYICAYANNMETDPFNFDLETLEMVSDYFELLIKNGILGDRDLNRVIAHPFLYSLLREMLFKAQKDDELDQWEGPCVTSKYALAFGNRLTYLAAVNVLGIDKDVSYTPGWGDQLTFELHEINNRWFVRIFNNDIQVMLNTKDGNIPLDEFREYVCSRLYFGDLQAVAAGSEDYHEMANVFGGSCTSVVGAVPLFGCKKKAGYQPRYNSQNELGWTRNELNNNERISSYGNGRMQGTVMYLGTKQQSGSSYSYSWSSDDSSAYNNQQPDSSYSYSWSSDDSSSESNQPTSSYSSNSYQTSSNQPSNSGYSYSSSASSQPINSGSSYSSSSNQPASGTYNQWDVSNSYRDPTVSRQTNTNKYSQDYFQKCEFCNDDDSRGFKEIARTEVEVPVIIKKPVTTYIDEEVCKTVTIPTYRKDYNLFRIAPVTIEQNKHLVHEITKCNTDFYDEEVETSDTRYNNIYDYQEVPERPQQRSGQYYNSRR